MPNDSRHNDPRRISQRPKIQPLPPELEKLFPHGKIVDERPRSLSELFDDGEDEEDEGDTDGDDCTGQGWSHPLKPGVF